MASKSVFTDVLSKGSKVLSKRIFTLTRNRRKQKAKEDNPNKPYINVCDTQAPNFPSQLSTGTFSLKKMKSKKDLFNIRS